MDVWAGSTWRRIITVLTGNSSSAPLDLTGHTASLVVRASPGSSPLYTLSTENGRITVGDMAGTLTLLISSTDTASFAAWDSNGIYELDVTDVGGNVTPLLWGVFRIHTV